MIDVATADLSQLTQEVERALDWAKKNMDGFTVGGINWADLHCVSAERYEDTSPAPHNVGLRVWIEEASPSAESLCLHVRTWLMQRGWDQVEVVTEW